MTEEPTVLMNILNIILMIVVYFVVMGGFIFFLCLLNYIFKHAKCTVFNVFVPPSE